MIEIDGIVRELEQPVSESGDYIADTYVRAIDLSTAPQPLDARGLDILASTLRRLNRNLATTSFYLSGSECRKAYDDVVVQLNEVNVANPHLEQLRPLLGSEECAEQWSTRFKFYDTSAAGLFD